MFLAIKRKWILVLLLLFFLSVIGFCLVQYFPFHFGYCGWANDKEMLYFLSISLRINILSFATVSLTNPSNAVPFESERILAFIVGGHWKRADCIAIRFAQSEESKKKTRQHPIHNDECFWNVSKAAATTKRSWKLYEKWFSSMENHNSCLALKKNELFES